MIVSSSGEAYTNLLLNSDMFRVKEHCSCIEEHGSTPREGNSPLAALRIPMRSRKQVFWAQIIGWYLETLDKACEESCLARSILPRYSTTNRKYPKSEFATRAKPDLIMLLPFLVNPKTSALRSYEHELLDCSEPLTRLTVTLGTPFFLFFLL